MPAFLESLESRRLFSVDLALSIASTTLPGTAVPFIANKLVLARVTLTNTNTDATRTNRDLPLIPLILTLNSSTSGTLRTLGQFNLSARNLPAQRSKSFNLQFTLPYDTPVGTYTVTASAASPELLADPNPDNNTANLGTVNYAGRSGEIALRASARVAPLLKTGAHVSIRTKVSNLGNIPYDGFADLEITSTVAGRTEILTVFRNVKIKVEPGKHVSLKPVTVRPIGDPAGNTAITLSARLTNIQDLSGDNPDNNLDTAATSTILPPPPSVFISARPDSPVILGNTLSFKRTSITTSDPNFVSRELGTWVDSNGRTGTYDYRQNRSGADLHALFLNTNSGDTVLVGNFAAPYTLANKTLTFSTNQARSDGSLSTLNTTLFFRYRR